MSMDKFIDKALNGDGDSDRHFISLYAMALASRGKNYVELGVREGHTSEPLYEAARANGGKLWSVDINQPTEYQPYVNGFLDINHYEFVQDDSIHFLETWPKDKKIDVAFVDDWHSYKHVKKQLELLDQLVGPSSIILLHDLMYGNTDPFYHSDLAHAGLNGMVVGLIVPLQN